VGLVWQADASHQILEAVVGRRTNSPMRSRSIEVTNSRKLALQLVQKSRSDHFAEN
jgi:hypothetical protein